MIVCHWPQRCNAQENCISSIWLECNQFEMSFCHMQCNTLRAIDCGVRNSNQQELCSIQSVFSLFFNGKLIWEVIGCVFELSSYTNWNDYSIVSLLFESFIYFNRTLACILKCANQRLCIYMLLVYFNC